MHRSGAHLDIVRLQDGAPLRGPILVQAENHLLQRHGRGREDTGPKDPGRGGARAKMSSMRPLAPLSLIFLAGCTMPSLDFVADLGDGPHVQGSGPVVTNARTAKSVTRIVVGGGVELDVRIGSPSIRISAQKNIAPLIKTRFENGTLTISPEGNYSTSETVRAVVQMPSLTSLTSSGGSSAVAQGFPAKALDLTASGAGQILWKGDATSLSAEATGGATVRLKGAAKSATLEASGAGAVDIDRLNGGDLIVKLEGSSQSSVPGRAGKLRVEASGASVANFGTLTSNHASVEADGASTVKIGRTSGGSAKATGASRIEYRGKLDRVENHSASEVIGR
ncbi:hypothetical protein EON81_03320 [bacterium]|nr:MAG: hypothetical protein EON81_03320 [bacterium]